MSERSRDIIDLRSDTFTLPTDGMRRAIAEAEIGNSGYREDPSVNALEEEIAGYFGQEAAVFLPSATMAGQLAIATWSRPGDVVVIEDYGHNYYFETGAMGFVAGVQARTLPGRRGILDSEDIGRVVVHPENPYARTSLIVLENTSNFGGGTIYPQATLEEIFLLARENGLPVHIDGARIWNAIVAAEADPRALVQRGGSLSVCFSKGLGAPMGALLLGPADFVAEARRIQAMLGGVMRQVGFMAAAALYGFRHQLERLAEDHANAALLADRIADHPAVTLDRDAVQTNILYFEVRAGAAGAARLVTELGAHGIRALTVGKLVRLVTHIDVTRENCVEAADTILQLLDD